MRKQMYKAIALVSALVVCTGIVSGCKLFQSKPVAGTSEAESGNAFRTMPETSELPETYGQLSAEDELLAFINGEAEVRAASDTLYALQYGVSYTFNDMCNAIEETYRDTFGDYNPKSIVKTEYAIIDCANDGVPEMAVRVTGDSPDRMDQVEDYYIIKSMGGELRVVDWYESYYRSFGMLNKYGVFYTSGSGGASIMVETYDRVNAAGQHEFIYSAEYELAMGAPIIYGYELPSDAELPDNYPRFAEDYGTNERGKYSFAPYDMSFRDGSKEYDDYLRKMVYIFHDENGNLIVPSDEYQKLYSDIGIVITDDDNLNQLIVERLHELGISDEEMKNPETNPEVAPTWVQIN